MTWDREPKGLWEREGDSWRTGNQQRGGLSFNKPRAEDGRRGLRTWKRQPQRVAPGLHPGLSVLLRVWACGFASRSLAHSICIW